MKKFLKSSYLTLIILFLYAPILVTAVQSFNSAKSRGVWGGFTFGWYKELFSRDDIMEALGVTLICAIIASLVATLIGSMAAYGIGSSKKKSHSVILSLAYIPMLNADIVTGISLMLLFTLVGLELSFTTMVLSHITFCIPYVILSVLPKVRQLDWSLYDAARDLGCTPTKSFWKVIFPELLPGILTGFLLALTMSLDDFIISNFTTGSGANNLSTLIYSAKLGLKPEFRALSTIIFAVIFIILIVVNIVSLKKQKKIEGGNEI